MTAGARTDWRRPLRRAMLYVLLVAGGLLTVGPLVWMLFSSLKSLAEVTKCPPTLLPDVYRWDNYPAVMKAIPYWRLYFNSLMVATVSTLSVLFFSALGGYTFGKFRFPGRDLLFTGVVATMLVPFSVKVIPLYLLMVRVRLVDTYPGLLAPTLMSAFGVFMMRQFVASVPNDLIDASRIDGCPEFYIFSRVVVPQLKPALGALAVFNFMWNWDSLLWPLVVVNSPSLQTIPIGLAMFVGEFVSQTHLIMAAASIAILPVLVVFAMAERQIIQGITLTGIKG